MNCETKLRRCMILEEFPFLEVMANFREIHMCFCTAIAPYVTDLLFYFL